MRPDPSKLLDPVLAIARQAGREILEVYRSDFVVEMKADRSPLTAADRAAHRVIAKELARLTPGVPVWSEESAAAPFEERSRWTRFWLVDPLDGTTEFVKRNGEFTVNLALIEAHQPVLGVVHVPVLDRDYFGGPGCGAFRRDGAGAACAITVRRPAQDPPRVLASRSHRAASLDRFLARLGRHELAVMGSSLKMCLVAEGAADVYPCLGPTSEWDTAAGQAVVEAAGGHVVDMGGQPLLYNRRAEALNPWFLAFGDATRQWAAYVLPQAAP
jgi:3'(2'), 5'-bisphosphate nucleotidase